MNASGFASLPAWARALVLPLLSFGSCGSVDVEPPRYHRLSMPSPAAMLATGATAVRVDGFSLAPHLRGERLVAVLGESRVEPYRNDLWAAPLGEMVQDVVLRALMGAGCFAAVIDGQERAAADVTLSGRVLACEAVREADGFRGRVEIAFSLRDEASGRLLWQGRLAAGAPAGDGEPELAAVALGSALGNVLSRLIDIAEREISETRASPAR